MNFSQKVAARNLFRYKKRLLMTVVGVAGCTALIFTGFGLRDSISTIVGKQYNEIRTYDMEVDLKQNTGADDKQALSSLLESVVTDSVNLRQQSVDVLKGGKAKDAYLVVAENKDDIKQFINLRERVGGKPLELSDDSVIITEKLSSIMGLKTGDTITLRDTDGVKKDLNVGGICENYLLHYIYMSPALYKQTFGEDFVSNQMLCKISTRVKADENTLSDSLMKQSAVSSVSFTSSLRVSFSKMIVALRYVVLVLIASAALLAFVVLFSLTSINIDERNRELATIKLLGFYPGELAAYVYRENIILTLLGTACGLFLGIFMERYVITTSEVDLVMFSRDLLWQSYVYSAALTFVFAALVNLIMLPRLKKIDMVSSLKSVE